MGRRFTVRPKICAVPLLLGHTETDSTLRHPCVELKDALAGAEATETQTFGQVPARLLIKDAARNSYKTKQIEDFTVL